MSIKKAISCIKNHHNFLITTHTNSEGDALGGELAFYRLLKKMGKRAIIINDGDFPPTYAFFPGINKIKKFKKSTRNLKFDCFVALDCASLKRCGKLADINLRSRPILNIDHHISNEMFGEINWIKPNSSSCCEMLYELYRELHIPLDKTTAMLLYVGIFTDTGSFHYSNTSALTHSIVAELLKFNLNIVQIYKNIYENIPFKEMQLLIKILPTLSSEFAGKVAYFQIKKELIKNKKLSVDLMEYILTLGRAIQNIEVVVVFRENVDKKNQVRVNFRSQGKVDVNKIARFFGGGGHKAASGCTVKGKIQEVSRKVLSKIKENL